MQEQLPRQSRGAVIEEQLPSDLIPLRYLLPDTLEASFEAPKIPIYNQNGGERSIKNRHSN